jgi:hypothetical protein
MRAASNGLYGKSVVISMLTLVRIPTWLELCMLRFSVWGSPTTIFVGKACRAKAIHSRMLPTCKMRRAKLSYKPI